MVVVMQLFATDENAPWNDIRTGIGHAVAAISEKVPDAVDNAGGPERDPRNLCKPDEKARHYAEYKKVQGESEGDAIDGRLRIQVPLNPVVRRPMPVTLKGFLVERFLDVEEDPEPEDPVDTVDLGTMR